MADSTVRSEMHELIDGMSEEELVEAKRYVDPLRSGYSDMLSWMLDTAPIDDEPTTPEEDATAEAAWQEYLREGGISANETKRTLLSCLVSPTT